MKSYLFLILILVSCNQANHEAAKAAVVQPQHQEDSILISIMHGESNGSVDSCVYVSYDLEKDSLFNHLLREYLCNNQFGHDEGRPQDSLTALVKRESFLQMILLFYDGDKYKRVRYNGDQDRMNDLRRGYLFTIDSCCTDRLQTIADALLQRDYFDGLECLWEQADLQRLPSLKGYLVRMDSTNFYYDARIAAFLHVKGEDSLSKTFVAKAARVSGHKRELDSLRSLMKRPTFSGGDYERAIYGEE